MLKYCDLFAMNQSKLKHIAQALELAWKRWWRRNLPNQVDSTEV